MRRTVKEYGSGAFFGVAASLCALFRDVLVNLSSNVVGQYVGGYGWVALVLLAGFYIGRGSKAGVEPVEGNSSLQQVKVKNTTVILNLTRLFQVKYKNEIRDEYRNEIKPEIVQKKRVKTRDSAPSDTRLSRTGQSDKRLYQLEEESGIVRVIEQTYATFDSYSIHVRSAANVSSITDNGFGKVVLNLTTPINSSSAYIETDGTAEVIKFTDTSISLAYDPKRTKIIVVKVETPKKER